MSPRRTRLLMCAAAIGLWQCRPAAANAPPQAEATPVLPTPAAAETPEVAKPDASATAAAPPEPSADTETTPCDDTQRVVQRAEGTATYYHDKFTGRKTASGEPYSPKKLTAAHRNLPFGTLVRVTRTDVTDQKLSVCVRINDRGPFGGKRRIIDLSRSAAESLDMMRAGVVSVKLEVLEAK